MRYAIVFLAVFVTLVTGACSDSTTGPSLIGSSTDISGSWTGTLASSSNAVADIGLNITQSGATITGTWSATSVSWSGQLTGKMTGSSFSGQLTFSGTTVSQAVCTGSAEMTGSGSSTKLTLTSAAGVVGPACPAALPVGIQIDLQR